MVHSRALLQAGCKILGLLFLVSSANTFLLFVAQGASIFTALGESPAINRIYSSFAVPISYLIFAFIFLKYSDTIAQKLDTQNQEINITPGEKWPTALFNTGIRLIGVYFVAKGIPEVISQASHTFMRYQTASRIPIYGWAPLFATLLYLALGLHLLAGGALIIKLTERLNQHNA